MGRIEATRGAAKPLAADARTRTAAVGEGDGDGRPTKEQVGQIREHDEKLDAEVAKAERAQARIDAAVEALRKALKAGDFDLALVEEVGNVAAHSIDVLLSADEVGELNAALSLVRDAVESEDAVEALRILDATFKTPAPIVGPDQTLRLRLRKLESRKLAPPTTQRPITTHRQETAMLDTKKKIADLTPEESDAFRALMCQAVGVDPEKTTADKLVEIVVGLKAYAAATVPAQARRTRLSAREIEKCRERGISLEDYLRVKTNLNVRHA